MHETTPRDLSDTVPNVVQRTNWPIEKMFQIGSRRQAKADGHPKREQCCLRLLIDIDLGNQNGGAIETAGTKVGERFVSALQGVRGGMRRDVPMRDGT